MHLPVLLLALLAAACSSPAPARPAAIPSLHSTTHRALAPPFRALPTCPPAGDSPSPQGCPP